MSNRRRHSAPQESHGTNSAGGRGRQTRSASSRGRGSSISGGGTPQSRAVTPERNDVEDHLQGRQAMENEEERAEQPQEIPDQDVNELAQNQPPKLAAQEEQQEQRQPVAQDEQNNDTRRPNIQTTHGAVFAQNRKHFQHGRGFGQNGVPAVLPNQIFGKHVDFGGWAAGRDYRTWYGGFHQHGHQHRAYMYDENSSNNDYWGDPSDDIWEDERDEQLQPHRPVNQHEKAQRLVGGTHRQQQTVREPAGSTRQYQQPQQPHQQGESGVAVAGSELQRVQGPVDGALQQQQQQPHEPAGLGVPVGGQYQPATSQQTAQGPVNGVYQPLQHQQSSALTGLGVAGGEQQTTRETAGSIQQPQQPHQHGAPGVAVAGSEQQGVQSSVDGAMQQQQQQPHEPAGLGVPVGGQYQPATYHQTAQGPVVGAHQQLQQSYALIGLGVTGGEQQAVRESAGGTRYYQQPQQPHQHGASGVAVAGSEQQGAQSSVDGAMQQQQQQPHLPTGLGVPVGRQYQLAICQQTAQGPVGGAHQQLQQQQSYALTGRGAASGEQYQSAAYPLVAQGAWQQQLAGPGITGGANHQLLYASGQSIVSQQLPAQSATLPLPAQVPFHGLMQQEPIQVSSQATANQQYPLQPPGFHLPAQVPVDRAAQQQLLTQPSLMSVGPNALAENAKQQQILAMQAQQASALHLASRNFDYSHISQQQQNHFPLPPLQLSDNGIQASSTTFNDAQTGRNQNSKRGRETKSMGRGKANSWGRGKGLNNLLDKRIKKELDKRFGTRSTNANQQSSAWPQQSPIGFQQPSPWVQPPPFPSTWQQPAPMPQHYVPPSQMPPQPNSQPPLPRNYNAAYPQGYF